MTQQEAVKLANQLVESFSRGDWDLMRSLYTSGAVSMEMATQRSMHGPEEIVQGARAWKEALPDAKGTINSVIAGEDRVAFEVTWEGTQSGPIALPSGSLRPSGKRISMPAVEMLVIQNGKIREEHHYFDLMSLMEQVGVERRAA